MDVAGLQGRHQDLFDVGAEALAIDRKTPGAVSPVTRNAARNVLRAPAGGVVDARAARCPAVPPKQLVVMPVSSRNRGGRRPTAPPRVRSCSDGRTVFFIRPRARTARQTVGSGRGEGVLQLSQRAIRLRRNQRGQGVQVRLKCSAVHVAGREAPPRPFRAAAVSVGTRSRGTSPPHRPPSSRHRFADPSNRHASRIRARKSTTTAPGVPTKNLILSRTNALCTLGIIEDLALAC